MDHFVKRMKGFSVLVLVFAAAAVFQKADLRAEAIYMKDGRVVYGRILFQDDRDMQIRSRYGVMMLKKLDIQRVDYELGLGTVTVIMKDKQFVNGTLISITASKVVVREDTSEAVEHDIPRTDIESLLLKKFEGRHDNIFGITGGFLQTQTSLKKQLPYGYIDITAFYARPIGMSPFFLWGVNASYIKMKANDKKSPLDNPKMNITPFLITLQAKYPILSLIHENKFTRGFDFYAEAGFGVSYVTLSENDESKTGSYYTMQYGGGLSYTLAERVYCTTRADYLYISQKKMSYKGIRYRAGAGFMF